MTRQEVQRMLMALENMAKCLNVLCNYMGETAARLDDLCECIGTMQPGVNEYKFLRVYDESRE